MVRIQLSSLDEFVASLSRLDYEAAKVASGKVMEDHIRMGALMFSLLTIEMMYTSMDYLTPENFRRGNGYLLSMYNPLPRQLNKLLRKLVAEYEEEHRRLINTQGSSRGTATHNLYDNAAHTEDHGNDSHLANVPEAGGQHLLLPQTTHSIGSLSQHSDEGMHMDTHDSRSFVAHSRQSVGPGTVRPATEYPPRKESNAATDFFDPNRLMVNMEEAENVLKELEIVRQFVEFLTKFVEIRKTMVVLYRFIAVTGPVLYEHKLEIMLERCQMDVQDIEPNSLYSELLEHVRYELDLVSNLVQWNGHIVAYDFVQAVTCMKRAKQLLKSWQSTLPMHAQAEAPSSRRSTAGHSIYESISDALSGRRDKDSGISEQHASHGLLYTALAKSSRIVQSLLWPGSGSGTNEGTQNISSKTMRGTIVWINAWIQHLTFKTTTYFQQIIAPYRSLYHEDITASSRQTVVMNDTWSRAGTTGANLFELASEFMEANDGCFVALLFESSKQHPFVPDGFALTGTKVHVSDYRVQACAVLFCFTNQKLLLSRGISVKSSLVHDMHTSKSSFQEAVQGQQQSDVEWFRQNCLPDILYVLDSEKSTLDYEFLGSSPLLSRLGNDADELLVELSESVHDTVDEAAAQLAIAKEARHAAENGAYGAALADMQPGSARTQQGQAAETLRLSAMKAVSSTEQRYHQKYDSKRHSPTSRASANERASAPLNQRNTPESDMQHTPGFSSGSGVATFYDPASKGSNSDMSLSLYSTYLQKSHLRNNVQRSSHARGPGGRRSTVRQMDQHGLHDDSSHSSDIINVDGFKDAQRLSSVYNTASAIGNSQVRRGSTANNGGDYNRQGTARDLSMEHSGLQRPFLQDNRVPKTADPSIAIDYLTSKRSADGLRTGTSATNRRVSTDASVLQNQLQKQSAYDSVPRRSGRATTSTLGTANTKPRRPSLSIRSFFRQAPRPSSQARTQPTLAQTPPENEVMRRVHCGERLYELFGPWSEDEVDSIPRGGGGSSHRPSSIHSLSFSTPTRTSLGGRTGAGVADAAAADAKTELASASVNVETPGSRFVLRLPRPSAQSIQAHSRPQGSRPPAARRSSEFGLATAVEFLQHRSQQSKQQHTHDQPGNPQPHATPAAGHRPSTPTATACRSEGYTYLYSRVGLPNVVLVAVILDSDKGLDRRQEAEHAWDGVVDAVRGAPLFERMMAFSS
ncbi:hypothetical protein BX667DRAFT_16655 [Coemansia mojavensis]|nr:hypothetical protein BX667DRAFT_16655 [Coemansia mojavensis]KAJ1739335.1 hypothetical protein LPJ68_004770 [Coemansia sp. RSA 1086]